MKKFSTFPINVWRSVPTLPNPRILPIAFSTRTQIVSKKENALTMDGAMKLMPWRILLRIHIPKLINALIIGPKNPPVSTCGALTRGGRGV